jgi:hypothetical protein
MYEFLASVDVDNVSTVVEELIADIICADIYSVHLCCSDQILLMLRL